MDNIAFMRKAKAQLAGHWGNAAIGTLILLVLLTIASYTVIGGLIVSGPLTVGYILFIGCLVDTRTYKLDLLFKGFDRFVETMIAGSLYSIAVAIGTALLIVPGIIISMGLTMAFFIMADDPNISGIDALKQSWAMMKGHKWDLFCLELRFISWMLLCVLTFGIGLLWLYPYMLTATLNFYRQLRYGTF